MYAIDSFFVFFKYLSSLQEVRISAVADTVPEIDKDLSPLPVPSSMGRVSLRASILA